MNRIFPLVPPRSTIRACKLVLRALLILCFVYTVGSRQVFASGGTDKIKVLLVTGGHGFEETPFFKVFKDDPDISFTPVTQGKTNGTVFERPDLLSYDVVLLYDISRAITESQIAGFHSMIDKGMGLVVLHHSIVSYQHWPDYERIIGGKYPEDDGKAGVITAEVGYQHDVDVPVKIVGGNHPITAGMKDFMINDEIYWGYHVGADITPLITTTHPKSAKPLAWCRTEGKSRVVYLQLGHGPSAFNDANFRQLVWRSIDWAAKRLGNN
jgi:type 1 glutamine amidotransferase